MSRDFSGTTDRLDWTSPWTPSGGMTISFWLSADRNNTSQGLVCIAKAGGGYDGLYLWLSGGTTAGKLSFMAEGGTDLAIGSVGDVVPSDGSWHQYIVTWDGVINPATGSHIYKDGNEVSYAAQTAGATPNTYSGVWSFGGFSAIDNFNIDGRMAEIAVWDRVMSAGEITALAGGYAPSIIDYGANLKFYYSAKADNTTAEKGGAAATDDGTSYSSSHPTIKYGSPYYFYAQQ